MNKRHLAATGSVVVVLGLAGGAAAQQTPADQQYEGPAGGAQPAGEVAAAGDEGLPFTGFQAALVALGGAGVAATGFVLRRAGRAKRR